MAANYMNEKESVMNSIIRKSAVVLGIFTFVLALQGSAFANVIIDEALFHADFNGSMDDQNGSDISAAVSSTNVNYVNITTAMANSNGKGVSFNGTDSVIKYGLGASNELRLQHSLTYHARVKFDRVDGLDFIMGRSGTEFFDNTDSVSWLQIPSGDSGCVQGLVVNNKDRTAAGHATSSVLETDVFYDVFLRFQAKVDGVNGKIQTVVYNAETGELAVYGNQWTTSIETLYVEDTIEFTIGGRNYSARESMLGVIEQVNVWDRYLDVEEMASLSVPEPATLSVLLVGGMGLLARKNAKASSPSPRSCRAIKSRLCNGRFCQDCLNWDNPGGKVLRHRCSQAHRSIHLEN